MKPLPTRCARDSLRSRSLWVKLLAGYLLVALAAVGLVAVLANRTTAQQFAVYVSQGKRLRAERLVPSLAAYYTQSGSWAGVDGWLTNEGSAVLQSGGRGQGSGHGQGGTLTDRLIVADGDGRVVADSQGSLVGEQLSNAELAQGAPIEVDSQAVGTLLIPAEATAYESLEHQFLSRVNRSLLWAGLAAAALALVLGLILARQFTAPLRALTYAAQRLAQRGPDAALAGQPTQVEVRSQDEIGELGQAFNQMSISLAHQETLRRNLMADIAHELRTPLSVMRGDLEALLDGVYQPTPEALGSLQEETLLLSRLVDDLRALALAEAGQLRLERRPTDLDELLAGVVASFDLQAESQGQTLRLDTPSDQLMVEVDPQRVRQVVANLVSNALRHAASPGGHVVVSAVQKPGAVQVSVTDDGPGIAAEDLPYLFDRFWRADWARAEGSGLGLAITRELVRAHGGHIWVETTPGQGTAFYFTLPDSLNRPSHNSVL
jgi:signal transduction histidine kinase